tara:strand:+ start:4808 stop:5191 length:384 start_codon:yes stop_codon:yes gene_type:complete
MFRSDVVWHLPFFSMGTADQRQRVGTKTVTYRHCMSRSSAAGFDAKGAARRLQYPWEILVRRNQELMEERMHLVARLTGKTIQHDGTVHHITGVSGSRVSLVSQKGKKKCVVDLCNLGAQHLEDALN